MVDRDQYAASLLLGRELDGGWKVIEQMPRADEATGGHFSIGYVVERDGRRGFLKALDFSNMFDEHEPTVVLQAMTGAFNFERDVLQRCADHSMDRIVLAIDSGSTRVEGAPGIELVSYLIFEEAEHGDVRKAMAAAAELFNTPWRFRVLHHMAVALNQLHSQEMAHQDMKPSNVLVFAPDSSKLGDLGRVSALGFAAAHDNLGVAGDRSYAPLELLYGEQAPNWRVRRQACDLYLLGSLGVFLFSNVSMTAAVLAHLPAELRPGSWGGAYTGTYVDVLPHVRGAFDLSMDALTADLRPETDARLVPTLRQLCDPDPSVRGHHRARALKHGNPYSLERFIADFNEMARRSEIDSRRNVA